MKTIQNHKTSGLKWKNYVASLVLVDPAPPDACDHSKEREPFNQNGNDKNKIEKKHPKPTVWSWQKYAQNSPS